MFFVRKDQETELCKLMIKYGSDKGGFRPPWGHNYTQYYSLLFAPLRSRVRNVFELGIGSPNEKYYNNMGKDAKPGASLYAWRDYFTSANIYGADIDPDIIFEDRRIKTFRCDETNEASIHTMWSKIDVEFDIMIDDACHCIDANAFFFEHSVCKLARDGIYVIEDINDMYIPAWIEKIKAWCIRYPDLCFELVKVYNELIYAANTLLVIRYYSNHLSASALLTS